jgi:hypothetical protein
MSAERQQAGGNNQHLVYIKPVQQEFKNLTDAD